MTKRDPNGDRIPVEPTQEPSLEPVPEEERPKGVFAKVSWVMARLGRVPQNGYNEFHRYWYVEEADLVDMARPLMAAVGLIMIPTVMGDERHDRLTGNNKTTYLTRAAMRYRVVDGDADDSTPEWKREFTFDLVGEGEDPMDKGFYKAYTGANKYALMKLFQISQGDDPERPADPERGSPPRQQSGGQDARRQPAQASGQGAQPQPQGDTRRFSSPDREREARSYISDTVNLIKRESKAGDRSDSVNEQLRRAEKLAINKDAAHGDLMDAAKWLAGLKDQLEVEESPLRDERASWDEAGHSREYGLLKDRLAGSDRPKVDDMPAELAKITSFDEVKALKAMDDRKTAQAHYDARMFDLTGEDPSAPEPPPTDGATEEPEEGDQDGDSDWWGDDS